MNSATYLIFTAAREIFSTDWKVARVRWRFRKRLEILVEISENTRFRRTSWCFRQVKQRGGEFSLPQNSALQPENSDISLSILKSFRTTTYRSLSSALSSRSSCISISHILIPELLTINLHVLACNPCPSAYRMLPALLPPLPLHIQGLRQSMGRFP